MPQFHAKSDTWYSLASLRLLYSLLPLLGLLRIGSTHQSQESGVVSTLADNGHDFSAVRRDDAYWAYQMKNSAASCLPPLAAHGFSALLFDGYLH